MATGMTLFNSDAGLPAHLAAAFDGVSNVHEKISTPSLTFQSRIWAMKVDGETTQLTKTVDGETIPVPSVQVIVLNINPKRTRIFYAKAFVAGENQSPACWASDGEHPDADCKTPVAKTCASCPNSVKGSKITPAGKESTLCSTMKRLAVIPAAKLDMTPMLLKVPQTSMWDKNNEKNEAEGFYAWDQYVDYLRARGVKHTAAVVTRIKFDSNPDISYPKLLFSAVRWLEPNEVDLVLPMVDSPAVTKLLVGKISEGGETPAEAAPVAKAVAAPAPKVEEDDGGFGAAAPAAEVAPVAKPKAAAKPKATPAAPAQAAAPVVSAPAVGSDIGALAAAWDD